MRQKFDLGKYVIEYDGDVCWTLFQKVINQRGNNIGAERTEVVSYHGDLTSVLKSYAKYFAADEFCSGIGEYIDRIDLALDKASKVASEFSRGGKK